MEEVNVDYVKLPENYTWDELPQCFITDDGMLVALNNSNVVISTKEEALLVYHENTEDTESHKWLKLSELLY